MTSTGITFKAGDIVELKDSPPHLAAKKGARARVTKDFEAGFDTYINIVWVIDQYSNNQVNGNYRPSDFKLAKLTELYKPGDKVEFINTDFPHHLGRLATVQDPPTMPGTLSNTNVLRIKWDNENFVSEGWYIESWKLVGLVDEGKEDTVPVEKEQLFHCMKLHKDGLGFDKVGDITSTESNIRQRLAETNGEGTYFVKAKNNPVGFVFTASTGGWAFTNGM